MKSDKPSELSPDSGGKLWGAQTQRSLEHFSIGHNLMPREMITAYAILKRCAAAANHAGNRLSAGALGSITRVCDEILAGGSAALFGLRLWASVCLALCVAFWLQLDNPLLGRDLRGDC